MAFCKNKCRKPAVFEQVSLKNSRFSAASKFFCKRAAASRTNEAGNQFFKGGFFVSHSCKQFDFTCFYTMIYGSRCV